MLKGLDVRLAALPIRLHNEGPRAEIHLGFRAGGTFHPAIGQRSRAPQPLDETPHAVVTEAGQIAPQVLMDAPRREPRLQLGQDPAQEKTPRRSERGALGREPSGALLVGPEFAALGLHKAGFLPLGADLPQDRRVERGGRGLTRRARPIALLGHCPSRDRRNHCSADK